MTAEALPEFIAEALTDDIAAMPAEFRAPMAAQYRRRYQRNKAREPHRLDKPGKWIKAAVAEFAAAAIPHHDGEDEIAQRATRLANRCREAADAYAVPAAWWLCVRRAAKHGARRPVLREAQTWQERRARMAAELARYCDRDWWRRRLRAAQGEAIERTGRRFAVTCRQRQPYVTDTGLRMRRAQQRRNRSLLEAMEAVRDDGHAITLSEIVERSTADPRIRRMELMTRIAGTEQVARWRSHAALFLTVTCPSRFHAVLSRSGDENPRHDGSTPRQGADYLNRVWANCRRWFSDAGLDPYGLRVREPQHDGTPHDHYLLFCPAGEAAEVERIMREWAMRDTPDEPGAARHRFDVERIDYARGSATGYVAKYISKSIDGHGIDADTAADLTGAAAAERVQAWAARWGIRQFQFQGCPPVGIWRMLRRLGHAGEMFPDELRAAVTAADAGAWADYAEAIGKYPLRLMKQETGRANRYGEPIGAEAVGVEAIGTGAGIICRLHGWTIRRKDECSEPSRRALPQIGNGSLQCCHSEGRGRGPAAPLEGGDRQSRRSGDPSRAERRVCSAPQGASSAAGDSRAPWSPVNNCTIPPADDDGYREMMARWAEVEGWNDDVWRLAEAERATGGLPPGDSGAETASGSPDGCARRWT